MLQLSTAEPALLWMTRYTFIFWLLQGNVHSAGSLLLWECLALVEKKGHPQSTVARHCSNVHFAGIIEVSMLRLAKINPGIGVMVIKKREKRTKTQSWGRKLTFRDKRLLNEIDVRSKTTTNMMFYFLNHTYIVHIFCPHILWINSLV